MHHDSRSPNHRYHPQHKKRFPTFFLIICLVIVVLFTYLYLRDPSDSQAAFLGSGAWSTSGNTIVDTEGNRVRITGINWFGMETETFAPHGLWTRGYKSMMDQMKQEGYNTIRLPFSNQILDAGRSPANGAINYSVNPDLQGLNSLQVMDTIIEYAEQIGMKVILDRHRPLSNAQSALWYTNEIPEPRWIADWQTLAERYKGNNTVIGADLHNEPHDIACWGCGDKGMDWKAAAQRAGNAIHSKNPDWLIIVQGIQTYNGNNYWWGGNLMGVKDSPIQLNKANKVVYSTHEYPSSIAVQPWFNDKTYPQNLSSTWDTYWGFIHKENIAPVLVSEFGTKLETDSDKKWFDALITYLGGDVSGIHWTYWSWNPNSNDTGGILKDDWNTINTDKQSKLATIQFVLGETEIPTLSQTISVSETPAPTIILPTAVPQGCPVTYKVTNQWADGFNVEVTVTNHSTTNLDNWTIEWDFEGNQKIATVWNGKHEQKGQSVTIKNAEYNGTIAPNQSITFGFKSSYSGVNTIPSSISLNGESCTILPL